MPIKIPFTNITISRGQAQEKRPYAYARGFSVSPERDMTGFKLSYDTFYTLFKNNGDVAACISKWMDCIGANGWILEDPMNPEGVVPDRIYNEIGAILNYGQPWEETLREFVMHRAVTGYIFAHMEQNIAGSRVLGLKTIDPRTLSVVYDKYGVVHRYVQNLPGAGSTQTFTPEEVMMHRAIKDPNNSMLAMSPMEPIVWEVRGDLEAVQTNYHTFRNDAVPSAHLLFDEFVTQEDEANIIASIQEQMKGSKNRGKMMAIRGVKEIKTIRLTPKDMEYLSGRKFTTSKVCSAYKMSPFLLGYTETVNNNNGVELEKDFYNNTVRTEENAIASWITKQLLCRIGLANPDGSPQLIFKFLPKDLFDNPFEVQRVALEEVKAGLITPRQYKGKTGQDVTKEDEANPNFDMHIIHSGSSAVALEDVGIVEPKLDANSPKNN